MTFLDFLRTARTTAATAYQQFLIDNPKHSNHVFLFFEGHDDPSFYFGAVQSYINNAKILHIFKCGNKREVYKTHEKVMRHSEIQNVTLFFVDKDLSDILGEDFPEEPNIYVTEYYSIENYLVTEEILYGLMIDTFHFQYESDKIDYQIFIDLFQRELVKFYQITLPLMAWVIYLRSIGQRPSLDNIELARIIQINDNMETIPQYDINGLYQYSEDKCKIINVIRDDVEISKIIESLSKMEPKVYIRGKYEIWFFVKFIEKLISVLEKSEKLKVKTRVSESTAITFLSPRVKTPRSLEIFIHNNLEILI